MPFQKKIASRLRGLGDIEGVTVQESKKVTL
jgi:hypothetical protein